MSRISIRLGYYPLLLSVLFVCLDGCGGNSTIPSIGRVKEYLVEVVAEGGKVIKEKAKSLADALQLAWRRLHPKWDGNIKIDPTDPMRGTLSGVYRLTVVSIRTDGKSDSVSIVLNNPRVQRETADSHAWEPDPSNFPPGMREKIAKTE